MTNVISPEQFKRSRVERGSELPIWENVKFRLSEFYGPKESMRKFNIWRDAHIKYARKDLEDTLSRARRYLGDDGVKKLLKDALERETANDN